MGNFLNFLIFELFLFSIIGKGHYLEAKKCILKNGLVFDSHFKKCAIPSGHSCPHDEFPHLNCTANSICSNNLCICLSNFSPKENGECRLNYGQNCKKSRECNPDKFLKCDSSASKCTCSNNDELVYDLDREACVSRGGKPCELSKNVGIYPNSCSRHAYCKESELENEEIDSDMELRFGICQCNEKQTRFDSNHSKCLVKAMEPCSQLHLDTCVQHAVCEKSICECISGYEPDDFKNCVKIDINIESTTSTTTSYFLTSNLTSEESLEILTSTLKTNRRHINEERNFGENQLTNTGYKCISHKFSEILISFFVILYLFSSY